MRGIKKRVANYKNISWREFHCIENFTDDRKTINKIANKKNETT